MIFIENCPQIAVEKGTHRLPANSSILIQITDPESEFVKPFYSENFKEIYKFQFYDVTEPLWGRNCLLEPITEEQANKLVRILDRAMEKGYNVVVHCAAGVCRSGAVTEVGKIMGFTPVHENRLPNVEVKSKMLRCLYDGTE